MPQRFYWKLPAVKTPLGDDAPFDLESPVILIGVLYENWESKEGGRVFRWAQEPDRVTRLCQSAAARPIITAAGRSGELTGSDFLKASNTWENDRTTVGKRGARIKE